MAHKNAPGVSPKTYLKLTSNQLLLILPAVNLHIYLRTSSLKRANNILKLPGTDYVAKNWALAMMLKALPLVHFWSVLLLKEQMITSVRKTLKTLISAKLIDSWRNLP